jgi:hypothetical protein
MLLAIIVTGWSFGQSPPKPRSDDGKSKQAQPEKPADHQDKPLEELIQLALRQNPDVQAAEAKVRDAEAELRRERVALALKVSEKHAAVAAQRQLTSTFEEEYRMYYELWKAKAGSEADMRRSRAQMLAAKLQLAQAEGALNTLVGTLPVPASGAAGPGVPNRGPGNTPASGIGGNLLGGTQISGGIGSTVGISGFAGISGITGGGISGISGTPGGISGITGGGMTGISGGISGGIGGFTSNPGAIGGNFGPAAPPMRSPVAPMADKLRTALNAVVKVKPVKDVPLADVVNSYRGAAGDVPFLLHLGDKAKEPVSLSLDGEVQLGAVFQAMEDVVPGLKCYVREYGILVTLDEIQPAAGMPLVEFWQKKPATEKAGAK